jgi:hypothetical protein
MNNELSLPYLSSRTLPESSVAGINLQGYNGFLHNVKQLKWKV